MEVQGFYRECSTFYRKCMCKSASDLPFLWTASPVFDTVACLNLNWFLLLFSAISIMTRECFNFVKSDLCSLLLRMLRQWLSVGTKNHMTPPITSIWSLSLYATAMDSSAQVQIGSKSLLICICVSS